MIPFLLLALGLLVLTLGAEGLVRGGSGLARRLGLSPLVIGLTLVAFGTSSPELAVALKAALGGSGDLMIGNVVGSNIFNVAVILGLSAVVTPLAVQLQVIRLDIPVMLGATLVFWILLQTGALLDRWEGLLLFSALVVYLTVLVRLSRRESRENQDLAPPQVPQDPAAMPVPRGSLLAVAGLAGLVGGSRLFVDQASLLARQWGVSEAVIGLTIVAVGTSLPELATSLVAAARRETDVAIGNLVGSNIFNLLAIGGLTSLVIPVTSPSVRPLDFVAVGLTSVLRLPLVRTGFRLVRWEGALLLALYAAYLVLRWPSPGAG